MCSGCARLDSGGFTKHACKKQKPQSSGHWSENWIQGTEALLEHDLAVCSKAIWKKIKSSICYQGTDAENPSASFTEQWSGSCLVFNLKGKKSPPCPFYHSSLLTLCSLVLFFSPSALPSLQCWRDVSILSHVWGHPWPCSGLRLESTMLVLMKLGQKDWCWDLLCVNETDKQYFG